MGEDRSATRRRLTVAQAADELGISVEAVRGRIKRGSLAHVKGEDGTVYVFLDADRARPAPDQSNDQALLIARLENEVQFLREELARRDAIVLNMTEAMKALSPPPQEEPSEPRESPETATEAVAREQPFTDEERPQEGAQPRSRGPWWRRIFGE
jgi:hypothetical protein